MAAAFPDIENGSVQFGLGETSAVFVSNLTKNFGNRELHRFFGPYGNVLKSVAYQHEEDNTRGCGIVYFKTIEEARNSIEALNGMQYEDQCLLVTFFKPKESKKKKSAQPFTKLHVNNLPPSFNEEKLREMFEVHGFIIECKIIKNHNRSLRQFGFVEFRHPHAAAAALCEVNGMKLDNNQKIFVARFKDDTERKVEISQRVRTLKSTICVKNFDSDTSDNELKDIFSTFGTIIWTKIVSYYSSIKAFGFICFSSPDEANKATEELNATMFRGSKLFVALYRNKKKCNCKCCNLANCFSLPVADSSPLTDATWQVPHRPPVLQMVATPVLQPPLLEIQQMLHVPQKWSGYHKIYRNQQE